MIVITNPSPWVPAPTQPQLGTQLQVGMDESVSLSLVSKLLRALAPIPDNDEKSAVKNRLERLLKQYSLLLKDIAKREWDDHSGKTKQLKRIRADIEQTLLMVETVKRGTYIQAVMNYLQAKSVAEARKQILQDIDKSGVAAVLTSLKNLQEAQGVNPTISSWPEIYQFILGSRWMNETQLMEIRRQLVLR